MFPPCVQQAEAKTSEKGYAPGTLGATGLKELEEAPKRAREERMREAEERAASQPFLLDWLMQQGKNEGQWSWPWAGGVKS